MVTSQTKRSVKDSIAAPHDVMAGQYRMILDMLTEEYTQLSSWAFGKSNNEGFDEYVIDNDEYLGVGSGAFSFLGDSLYVNTFSLRRYNERIGSGNNGVERRKVFGKRSILNIVSCCSCLPAESVVNTLRTFTVLIWIVRCLRKFLP